MGILNVTPDSFSDGGRFAKTHVAVQHAIAMAAAGADVIDIGGESTRPGSVGVSDAEQLARVLPVIRETRISGLTLPISIDTRSAAVAAAALDAGADMVNDVSAARHDPAMAGMLAQSGAAFVAMHMLGTPENMQNQPQYKNVVQNVSAFFEERAAALLAVGVDVANKMIVDPGIGFGKTLAHNLTLLRESSAAFGVRWPVLIGPSRKRFIGDLAGESNPSTHGAAKSNSRLMGTAAAVASCALSGVDMVRVHDVADMVAVIRVCESIAPS
ncbi:MAG: dihydropteroate synthase [Planctomycetes bacterium]|nr:dihydropteroate synthase [Planctomycetota bacterium]